MTLSRGWPSYAGQNRSRGGGDGRRRKGRTSSKTLSSARQLLDDKRSGKLAITKEDLEHYIKGQYTDAAKDTPLGSSGYVLRPDPPRTPFDTSPPRMCKVREVLKKSRSASAPGPNGLPYKVYKNCPQVMKILWKLMQVVWKNQSIPAEW